MQDPSALREETTQIRSKIVEQPKSRAELLQALRDMTPESGKFVDRGAGVRSGRIVERFTQI